MNESTSPAQAHDVVDDMIDNGELRVVNAFEAGATRPPQHHLGPQHHRLWFKERGYDVDEMVVDLDQATHGALHYGQEIFGPGGWWNYEVMSRLKAMETRLQRPLTADEISQELRQFAAAHGLENIHPYVPPGAIP